MRAERRHMAVRASWTCFVILVTFSLAGTLIFQLFGTHAGGLQDRRRIAPRDLGFEMLRAKRSATKETPDEASEGSEKEDVGIIPLGLPMLAGPGAISTVMVLMTQNPDWPHELAILGAIGVTSAIAFAVLASADRVSSLLHETGICILTRMMGLLLIAIAVQFVLNGLRDVGIARF